MTSGTIRRLTGADIEHAAAILSAAFGPSPWHVGLQRQMALQPDGMLLAEADGRPAGVVSGVDYGPFAYVGMLGVHPAAQRRGVAYSLMGALLAWLDGRGCPLALLDATAAGAPLYERLGFVDAGTSYLAASVAMPAPGPLPAGVAPLAPPDLDALAAFDAPIFGADRRAVLAQLQAAHPGRVLVTRDSAGALSGYVVAQARAVGPWVARAPADAELLLRAALACPYDEPPRAMVPGGNAGAAAILGRHGFQVLRPLRYMQRGAGRRPGDPAARYGLVSFALG